MSLIDKLFEKSSWERYYEYKSGLRCSKRFKKELREFIDSGKYLAYKESVDSLTDLPLPSKSIISKMSSRKKRTVYKYPYDFNMLLKLLTYLTLRKYDHIYAPNLYSFRPGVCAKDAIMTICRTKDLHALYSYKIDVSDYFNSIPVDKICSALDETISDDEKLLTFMKTLLKEERAVYENEIITEKKGIMAGTPIASFYANLYLKDLDERFREKGVLEYCEAARALKMIHPDAECVLLGGFDTSIGALKPESIQEYVEDESIKLLEEVKDPAGFYGLSSVFVLPSYYREGLPRTILEAMSCGRPVITTDWVGCREAIADGVNGFLVPIKDSKALSEKMSVLCDLKLAQVMGDKAFQACKEKYEVSIVNLQMRDIIGY